MERERSEERNPSRAEELALRLVYFWPAMAAAAHAGIWALPEGVGAPPACFCVMMVASPILFLLSVATLMKCWEGSFSRGYKTAVTVVSGAGLLYFTFQCILLVFLLRVGKFVG